MNFLRLIESKREGKTLAPDQIEHFVREFTIGTIPDYQMAAMLMAIYFRGLGTPAVVLPDTPRLHAKE